VVELEVIKEGKLRHG